MVLRVSKGYHESMVYSYWGYDYDDDYYTKKPKKFTDLYNDRKTDKDNKDKDGKCRHEWIEIGRSPVLDEAWINCKHCDIKKEDCDE